MKNQLRLLPLLILFLMIGVSPSFAVSGQNETLLSDTTLNVTVTGDSVCLPRQSEDFVFILHAEDTAGTNPTLDVKIQHSNDESVWFDLDTAFTQVTTVTSDQVKQINSASTHVLRCVRAVATLGGTASPSFNATVKAAYRIKN